MVHSKLNIERTRRDTMNQTTSLQDLFGINQSNQYHEFNIFILLDKDNKDNSYSKKIKFYEEQLEMVAPVNLMGDYMCVVIGSNTVSNSKITVNSIPEGDIYTKRFSGVIADLKRYIEHHKTYTKRYECTIPKYQVNVPDNKTPFCRFDNGEKIINIFLHNESEIREIDANVVDSIGQLIDMAQIKSEQLVIATLDESGKAVWTNHKKTTTEEVLQVLNENLKQGNYLTTTYDMVNSKQYYFDFTVIDRTIPRNFEKHFIVIGPVRDVQTFSKLNHICSKIRREGETIRMDPITLEDLKAHS